MNKIARKAVKWEGQTAPRGLEMVVVAFCICHSVPCLTVKMCYCLFWTMMYGSHTLGFE